MTFLKDPIPTKNQRNGNILIMVLIVVLLLIIVNMVGYWYITEGRQTTQSDLSRDKFSVDTTFVYTSPNTDTIAIEETSRQEKTTTSPITKESILESISTHIILDLSNPDIVPFIAEIIDIEALIAKDQIFIEAKNGDYFVLYGDHLVFYRPSIDKVILFQRIDPQQFRDNEEPSSEETPTTTLDVEKDPEQVSSTSQL